MNHPQTAICGKGADWGDHVDDVLTVVAESTEQTELTAEMMLAVRHFAALACPWHHIIALLGLVSLARGTDTTPDELMDMRTQLNALQPFAVGEPLDDGQVQTADTKPTEYPDWGPPVND